MVANKYAFLQITRRRFLNEWEAFKKVISRRNIRRRITIPLTLSNLKLLRLPRRFKIVVIDIQITLKQMLRDFIGIRVNRAKKSGMVNITSSVNSRERSGINTILHE